MIRLFPKSTGILTFSYLLKFDKTLRLRIFTRVVLSLRSVQTSLKGLFNRWLNLRSLRILLITLTVVMTSFLNYHSVLRFQDLSQRCFLFYCISNFWAHVKRLTFFLRLVNCAISRWYDSTRARFLGQTVIYFVKRIVPLLLIKVSFFYLKWRRWSFVILIFVLEKLLI